MLNKLDFTALEVSRRNYLKWIQDVKLHLTAKSLRATIKEPIDDELVDEAQKASAMIFIRRHIHDALQTKIRSLLKFNKEDLTEQDFLEKSYSTFNATNIVLQQQYRAQKFTKFSDLISVLLLAKKQNQLLMKNHQARMLHLKCMQQILAATTDGNHVVAVEKGGKAHHGPHGPPNRGLSKGGKLTQKHQHFAPKAPSFKNKGKVIVQLDST
ncbi:uncharacterized protein [Malus domestica]|uniref:uncharacterized protein n=1 Tax=Malus domestica TaxID=3750 RepID=UPI003976A472